MKHCKKPQLYTGIRLRLEENLGPREYNLGPISGVHFAKLVERLGGAGVVDEEFDPTVGPLLVVPSDVKLRDDAKFLVVADDTSELFQQVQTLQGWDKNYISDCKRQLGEALRKHALKLGHTKVDVVYNMKVVGPAGKHRELDAVAFADGCVFVGEYMKKMDSEGAEQLASEVDWIELRKDLGEGNVTLFKDKQIFGVLAGRVETSDTGDKIVMDTLVKGRGFLQWFEGVDFGPDPNMPSQASQASQASALLNTDGPDASPGNGTATTTPAAMPRRVRQVANQIRNAQVPLRTRMVAKFAGFTLSLD